MRKRSSKGGDVNQIAARVVSQSTQQPVPKVISQGKNPAAVALGRLGGLKGGIARAKRLTAKERSNIAKKAALTRWNAKNGNP
jgi:hypothetical protein